MATLYRCRTPTDWLCRCGTVAKRLRKSGIEFEEVRVPYPKSERPEVEELTGQRLVPVLVHGEEVIHDSYRIIEYIEYIEWVERRGSGQTAGDRVEPRSAGTAAGAR